MCVRVYVRVRAGEVHGPRIQVFAPAGVIVRDVFREIVLLLEHRYPKLLPLLNGVTSLQ